MSQRRPTFGAQAFGITYVLNHITEVQKKIEADLTVNSLGQVIDAGNEESPPTADSNPIHRTPLRYTVEDKRKIADPTLVS